MKRSSHSLEPQFLGNKLRWHLKSVADLKRFEDFCLRAAQIQKLESADWLHSFNQSSYTRIKFAFFVFRYQKEAKVL
ncbi:hypothetical protein GVM20_00435 [Porphyrobacter sp. SLTP]|uniref:hypothetical protein n=1 Tax=Porphyrobacter sp. SLTP TaxID=2683266 RepID=UPI001412FE75|nr:hypothetical protein [Porphyrobacter sp. SLTP]NBB23589.1 hypothetical protein [Porphyrobacter sp. SLTP]